MTRLMPSALAAILLLSACDARIGKSAEEAAPAAREAGRSAAEGKAEQGTFSIDAPGLDLKVAIPEAVAGRARAEGDIIYPGSRIGGMHIAADAGAERSSGVELRFESADPVGKVAAWYRDPARKDAFAVTSVTEDGATLAISGTQAGDGDPFTVWLSPARGGTEGRIALADRN